MNEEYLPGRTLQAGGAAQEGSEADILNGQSKPGGGFQNLLKIKPQRSGENQLVECRWHGAHSSPLRPCPVQWSRLLFPSLLCPGSSHSSLEGVFPWKLLIPLPLYHPLTSPLPFISPPSPGCPPHSWESCHHAE